ncbi:MAG TPA: RHS repeat-associated core domain-containing protein [Bryobacteraceae bacterium]|nr:RHS repeat-associated core domain-containing protein [Bryobacteraceae bacterium]
MDIQYAYPATQNNGKISSQYDNVSGEQITYMYDSLNRLASATGSGWGQSYNYDGFGNLTDQNVTSGTAPALHVTYDPATNRQTGECADANGNLCGSYYSYDVENRFVRKGAPWSVTPDVAYSYRPGNKRVWKGANYVYNDQTNWSLPSTDEVTFWSITGQKLATYNLSQYQPGGYYTQPQLVATQTGTNYRFGGKLVKNSTGYVTPDRLGSIGKYFPYGQERPSATQDGKEKFATYFRDSETGLDYADQRYHQVGFGRFLTPDPYAASANAKDPGSWNRYAYTGGDPANRSDPSGRDYCDPGYGCVPDEACQNPASFGLDFAIVQRVCDLTNYNGGSVFAFDLGQTTSATFLTFSGVTPYGGILGGGSGNGGAFGDNFTDPIEQLRQEWEDCESRVEKSASQPYYDAIDWSERHFVAIEGSYGSVFGLAGALGGLAALGPAGRGEGAILGWKLGLVTGAVDLDGFKLAMLALAAVAVAAQIASQCGSRP